jgi:DNA polymerase-3 subunit beta
MKFTIKRSPFASALARVAAILSSAKVSLPMLSNVLVAAKAGSVSLTTNNLDLSLCCTVKAEVEAPGRQTLPATRFAGIVRELAGAEVTIGDEKGRSRVSITSAQSTFHLSGLPAEEFPVPKAVEASNRIVLDQGELAVLLQSVAFAQSRDTTRYILNGVLFHIQPGKLTIVATDGRRLALASHDLPADVHHAQFILPSKAVDALGCLLGIGGNVVVSYNPRNALFALDTDKSEDALLGEVLLSSKLVEGTFPEYSNVVPKEKLQGIKLERELFLESVHRASLVCSEKANSVRLKLSPNTLEILAQSPEFGQAHEVISVGYSGPEIQVAFNPSFLVDPLRAITMDEVFLEVKDENSPGVFKTAGTYQCVVMPVRLS